MYLPDRADAVQWRVAGVEIRHFDTTGTVDGVTIDFVAGDNGEGTAVLRKTTDGALQWRPPGDATFGPPVPVPVDDTYRLEDSNTGGAKFVRVRVTTAFLRDGADESRVFLRRVYNNGVASDDVTAAESAAGLVETYTVDAVVVGDVVPTAIRVWLVDAALIELSPDGINWSTPTGVANDTIDLVPFMAGGTATLYLRRTVTAGAAADPDVLTHIGFQLIFLVFPP